MSYEFGAICVERLCDFLLSCATKVNAISVNWAVQKKMSGLLASAIKLSVRLANAVRILARCRMQYGRGLQV